MPFILMISRKVSWKITNFPSSSEHLFMEKSAHTSNKKIPSLPPSKNQQQKLKLVFLACEVN